MTLCNIYIYMFTYLLLFAFPVFLLRTTLEPASKYFTNLPNAVITVVNARTNVAESDFHCDLNILLSSVIT